MSSFETWSDFLYKSSNNWFAYSLGDVFSHRQERGGQDLELLAVTGNDGVVKRDTLERRDTSNPDKGKYLKVYRGDIAYNTMRMWQGVSGFSKFEGLVSPAYTVCNPKQELIDTSFAQYLFKYPLLISEFHKYSQGLVNDTLNLKYHNFSKIKILLPPLPEQQKIASILTSVDEVIEKTESQISKLQDLKKGMMQELLTKGIGHTQFKDSPVGRIPVGWEVKRLGDLSANGINNGVFRDPKKVGQGYRLINVYDMYQGFGIDPYKLELLDIDQKMFQKNKVVWGDVFFTRSSLKLEGIAFCNINLSWRDDLTYDGHLMKISPNQQMIIPEFLAYYCLTNYARTYFMRSAKHSTMTTIGQMDIYPLLVLVPSIEEQEKIVSVITSISNSIQNKQQKLQQTQNLKKSLMQDLLTGKVRVSVN